MKATDRWLRNESSQTIHRKEFAYQLPTDSPGTHGDFATRSCRTPIGSYDSQPLANPSHPGEGSVSFTMLRGFSMLSRTDVTVCTVLLALAMSPAQAQEQKQAGPADARARQEMTEQANRLLSVSFEAFEDANLDAREVFAALMDAGNQAMDRQSYSEAVQQYRLAVVLGSRIRHARLGEAESKLAQALRDLQLADRMAKAQARFDRNSDDRQAASLLLHAYLVERNDPVHATIYGAGLLDASQEQMLSLAIHQPTRGTLDQYLALSRWYESLADEASPRAKVDMLVRAHLFADIAAERASGEAPAKARAAAAEVKAKLQMLDVDQEKLSGLERAQRARLIPLRTLESPSKSQGEAVAEAGKAGPSTAAPRSDRKKEKATDRFGEGRRSIFEE